MKKNRNLFGLVADRLYKYRRVIAGALMLGVCVKGTFFCCVNAQEEKVANNNVYIGDTNVGGMNESGIREVCQTYVDNMGNTKVTFLCNDSTIEVTLADIGFDTNLEEAVDMALNYGNKGNVLVRYRQQSDLNNGESVAFSVESALSESAFATLENLLSELNGTEEPGSISVVDGQVVIVPEKRGIQVKYQETVDDLNLRLQENWDTNGVSIEVQREEVVPEMNSEFLGQMTQELGSYTTNYNGDAGRMKNVENAASFIDGTILMPGEEFDVNAAMEPFTLENGYDYAAEYSGGKVVQGIGGGICQVSTTLYNAVLFAELEVTERYNHSMTVGYVPLSMDAAIAGTTKNLMFKNNMETPIYISAVCVDGEITFKIFGTDTRDENRTIEFESILVETIPPGEPVETVDETLEPGTRNVTEKARNGYVAQLWKHIYVNGELVESVQVNSSKYMSTPEYVTVGPPEQVGPVAPSDGEIIVSPM